MVLAQMNKETFSSCVLGTSAPLAGERLDLPCFASRMAMGFNGDGTR